MRSVWGRAGSAFLALIFVGAGIAAMQRTPSGYFPHVVLDGPEGLELTFILSSRADLNECAVAATSLASATQASCPACRISAKQCLQDLEPSLSEVVSGDPIPQPAARLPDGIVVYRTPSSAVSLAACRESERVAETQGTPTVQCYPPGVLRPPLKMDRGHAAGSVLWRIGGVLATCFGLLLFGVGVVRGESIAPRAMARRAVRRMAGLPRRTKQLVVVAFDFASVILALWLAFVIRLDRVNLPSGDAIWLLLLAPAVAIPVFAGFGMYRAVIRYLGMHALWVIVKAVAVYALLWGGLVFLAGLENVPRSIILINGVLVLMLVGSTRLVARDMFKQLLLESRSTEKTGNRKNVLIFGAGSAGVQLASALAFSREFLPVAFIDDDASLKGQQVSGLRVHPPAGMAELIKRLDVQEVLLAMPSISRRRRREIIETLEGLSLTVRTLPGIAELARGSVKVNDLREVGIEDLLGRDTIPPDGNLLAANIQGKTVLVTGAGGSIGSELCRQILDLGPARLVLYEHSEFALYAIEQELVQRLARFGERRARAGLPKIVPLIGSCVDVTRMFHAMRTFSVQTVFHAAAYKHVPIVEGNPVPGVANNILGTYRTAMAALESGVSTFVLISTDKAVRPTNTMGATKRFAEMILQGLQEANPERTRFTMVRFGNVLDSSGSVIPRFREQIRNGGPVTVTDPRIIRYFMTIQEAAQLVIQAGAMGQGGDVFVLDMGEPVKILELAQRMIRLSGLTEKNETTPDGDIEIVFSGLRPGEKLYEELLIGDDTDRTAHPRIMRANEKHLPWADVEAFVHRFEAACTAGDSDEVRRSLLEAVGEFEPQCDNQDPLQGAKPAP